jgi:ribosome maturation factor RimP
MHRVWQSRYTLDVPQLNAQARRHAMPPAPAGRSDREQLIESLRPVVAAAGYELDDVTVTAAGRRSLVRVSVDTATPGSGIDLDGVSTVSRAISQFLDGADSDDGFASGPLAGPYVLEVSSPGVERPLTEPRHWRRAAGRLVRVDARDTADRDKGAAAERTLTGRVLDVSDRGVTLDVDGSPRELTWAQLGRGTVQVEFTHPDESGAQGA